jgi:hypothetical protein
MVIYSMLIYIISLILQPAMSVIINNQCSDIKLISPVHFIKNTTRHIQLPQQVVSNSTMKADFRSGIDRGTFGGVLLYHLQGKEDTSIIAQLLVIWGFRLGNIYSNTWIIEHESTLFWNEDKLKRLYDVYDSRYDTSTNLKAYLLNDSTMLKTECTTLHGGFEIEVIISEQEEEEEDQLATMKPLWVDSSR